jgi:MFS family permease
MSMVTNYKIFFVVRFLQGACCGLFSAVIPMIIREVSPHEISSITGLFANAFIIVGIFFLYLFGYLLGVVTGNPSGSETWIIIFLFPIVVILLQYLLLTKVYPF